MTTPTDVSSAKRSRAQIWKWVIGTAVAYLLLLVLWMIFDLRVLNPELMNTNVETTMDRFRWLGVPALILLTVLLVAKWYGTGPTERREREWLEKTQQLKGQESATQTSQKARREYVLEVLGLGVTYEKYRQGKLWDILQQGSPHASIREADPKKYPWMDLDKMGQAGGRSCDALENGAKSSPMYWGVPSFYAGGPIDNPTYQPSDFSPESGLAASAETTGMAWHLFAVGHWQLSERPDQLLEQVFAFFDNHPDLPYIVLMSADDPTVRHRTRIPGSKPLVRDGYYIPNMPDSTAVFVLARRERVAPLRPFVWEDSNNDYLQENLRRMYYQLQKAVPTLEKLAHPEETNMGRLPTVAEWLKATAAFAKHPYFKPGPNDDPPGHWRNNPPKDWKPTPWFPVPWTREQMETFDKLPSLGYIHRPIFVKFEDEQGKPVKRRDARQKILSAGWQQALQTLSDAERTAGPSRIIAAFGDQVEQQIALEGVLHEYAAQGGPEIDSGKTAQFINTDRRLGNTGAATFFMQMAIGVMGSYIGGGPSAAINLRDPSGASIVFISPPTAERLKAQEQRYVFGHKVSPAVDPANYQPPTVGAVMEAMEEMSAHASGTAKN